MATVWVCTREDVKAALDAKESARNNRQVDRAIAAGTDSIENDQLYRRFYPEVATRYFDWPCEVDRRDGTRTLSLGIDELIAATTVTVSGVVVDPEHYVLKPVNDAPPYTEIEFDSTVTLDGDEHRRAVEILGMYGYDDRDEPAGELAAGINSSVTTVAVTDSSAVGVGSLLLVDTERLIVTRKSMVTTGQTLQAPLTKQAANEIVAVTDGTAFAEGEVVLLDAEKLLVVEVAGNTLIVERCWDGSTLAEHTGSTIYAPRSLTVQRGVLGTTAAAHDVGAAVAAHLAPDLVRQLGIAEAITSVQQESAGYSREAGASPANRAAAGKDIGDLRERTYNAYGRKAF